MYRQIVAKWCPRPQERPGINQPRVGGFREDSFPRRVSRKASKYFLKNVVGRRLGATAT